jgi:hypothetical protein
LQQRGQNKEPLAQDSCRGRVDGFGKQEFDHIREGGQQQAGQWPGSQAASATGQASHHQDESSQGHDQFPSQVEIRREPKSLFHGPQWAADRDQSHTRSKYCNHEASRSGQRGPPGKGNESPAF